MFVARLYFNYVRGVSYRVLSHLQRCSTGAVPGALIQLTLYHLRDLRSSIGSLEDLYQRSPPRKRSASPVGKMPFPGVQINIHNIHFVNSTFNIFNSNVPIRVCPEFTNFQLILSFRAGGAKKILIFSQHPLHFLHEFRISGAQYSKKYLRFAPEARKKIMIFTSSHPTFSSEFTPEA